MHVMTSCGSSFYCDEMDFGIENKAQISSVVSVFGEVDTQNSMVKSPQNIFLKKVPAHFLFLLCVYHTVYLLSSSKCAWLDISSFPLI